MRYYLVVHGEDDHEFPEDGDEVQEEVHTVPGREQTLESASGRVRVICRGV